MEFGCGCYTIILLISSILADLTLKDKAIGIGILILVLVVAVVLLKIKDKAVDKVEDKIDQMPESTRKVIKIAKNVCTIIVICMICIWLWYLFIATTYLGKGMIYLGEYILNEIREFFNHFY